jgi:hypothetical protein
LGNHLFPAFSRGREGFKLKYVSTVSIFFVFAAFLTVMNALLPGLKLVVKRLWAFLAFFPMTSLNFFFLNRFPTQFIKTNHKHISISCAT